MSRTSIVVPTVGRASLRVLLEALRDQTRSVDVPVILVDDRPGGDDLELPAGLGLDVRVLTSGGRGPARARNLGWRQARSPWVSFLDDDVVPDPGWFADLGRDLDAADQAGAIGTTGRVRVPLPDDRRPTDWERGTAGLAEARWITADLGYRRCELARVGGFDERFPRAFREDADLALRLGAPEGGVLDGCRRITHPVRPADDWASLRQQAGNADDALMRVLHGPDWHRRAEAMVGRRPRHLAVTAAGALALTGLALRRPRAAGLGLGTWLAGTAELAWARIAPGPRDAAEVRRMLVTSAAIPAAATWHTLRGAIEHRDAAPWRGMPDAVLLDRDGTLVHDVPYNGDPDRVVPLPGVKEALDRLRAEGIRLGVVTNQSGIARGLLTREEVDAVNGRVTELLGPFDTVQLCPHGPDDGCACRKPAPGMVRRACAELGVAPEVCVLVGDIGSDVEAARAAGASPYLVPTAETETEEWFAAPRVASSLGEVVDCVLAGVW